MNILTIGLSVLLMVVGGVGGMALAEAPPMPNDDKPHTFTLGEKDFLLDGKPFQIRGGEMHPERIPAAYWRQRIQMAKAMGLNTIAVYVFWNAHEVSPGHFDFSTGRLDTAKFLQIAKQEGMWVLMRPGPYCCGEWDLGGLPAYLLKDPKVKLRCMSEPYTGAVERYFTELAKVVRPNMAAHGGPILMVQVENEYGSYPRRDHAYMVWLRDLWVKLGVSGPFYTADGAGEGYLKGIVIPGVAVGLDTGTNDKQFALASRINPGVPIFTSEAYPGWLRHWGERDWRPSDVSGLIKYFMITGKSFNLYMFHGGTNFGFTAGANSGGRGHYEPDVTSYDYGSPLNEQGEPTAAYFKYRKELAAYLPKGESLPPVPATIPAMDVAPITPARWTSVWDHLGEAIDAAEPTYFEAIGQDQGMMVYSTRIPAGGKQTLTMANLHDYAEVFVDGKLIATLDRRLGQHTVELPARTEPATLEVLVEAMGHINFTQAMESDRKGLYGDVTLGAAPLKNWRMRPVTLREGWLASLSKTDATSHADTGNVFKAPFTLGTVADTYFDMSKYQKGYVWVNGHNLGRYWNIGPQRRLYCPAGWLKKGENQIIVLDLHQAEPQPIAGCKGAR